MLVARQMKCDPQQSNASPEGFTVGGERHTLCHPTKFICSIFFKMSTHNIFFACLLGRSDLSQGISLYFAFLYLFEAVSIKV